MQTELIHVGFENHIALNRVLAVAAPGSAPVKRMVQRGKEEHRAIAPKHGPSVLHDVQSLRR